MSENVTAYPAMAAQADIWVLQTQVLQAGYAAETYRQEVDGYVQLIRSGNPEIKIWAQITIPPEQELEASYWLMYHHAIADLVDGTYLGLYTWDTLQAEDLLALMESIYVQVCGH